ncbi:hypothetical protein K1719_045431 [Acacia pycnantha]|nr:hypothetical protein K1719_045431 [Acacia pycnantha]
MKELKDTFKAVDGLFDEVTEDHKKVMKKKKKDNVEKKDFVDILLQLQKAEKLEFELTKDDLKAIFIPFGSGKRTCPGMAFGLSSVEYMLANLLHWFDWKLPEDGSPECEIDVSETYGLTVKKKVPLFLQPIPFSSLQAQSP